MTFWLWLGGAVGIALLAVVIYEIEISPVMARHEEEASRHYRIHYVLQQELEAERRSRKRAEEQIAVMTRSVIESGKDLKELQKKLKTQRRSNAKLKKTMRRKKKPIVSSGGRGKKRCMNVFKPENQSCKY